VNKLQKHLTVSNMLAVLMTRLDLTEVTLTGLELTQFGSNIPIQFTIDENRDAVHLRIVRVEPEVVSFDPEDIVPKYERVIVMASWLYYHSALESPWSDAEYDQIVNYVLSNWHATTKGFRGRTTREELQGTSYHIKATEDEIAEAIRLATEKGKTLR
jgi:hypothetical protein